MTFRELIEGLVNGQDEMAARAQVSGRCPRCGRTYVSEAKQRDNRCPICGVELEDNG